MQHVQGGNVEHMYHVLEAPHYPSRPQYLNETGRMTPDSELVKPNSSAIAEQVPIYQDVAELCPSLGTANEKRGTDHNPDNLSAPKQLVVPVYQEIAELSTERVNSRNTMHVYAQVPSADTIK